MNVSVSFRICICLYTMLSWTVAATAKPICFHGFQLQRQSLLRPKRGMVNVGVTIPNSPDFLGLWVVTFADWKMVFWSIPLPFSFWRLRCEIEIIHIKSRNGLKKKRGPCQVQALLGVVRASADMPSAEGWAPVLWPYAERPGRFFAVSHS